MAIATSLAEAAVALLFAWKAFDHFARGEYLSTAVAGLVAGVSTRIFFAVTSGKKVGTPGSAPADLSQPAVARTPTLRKGLWAFSAVLIPALLYLAFSFGASLSTGQQTQQGWAAIGFTGFDIGTSFSEGLRIMVEGLLDQSAWYYLWLPFLLYGAFRLSRFLVGVGPIHMGRRLLGWRRLVRSAPVLLFLHLSCSRGRASVGAGSAVTGRCVGRVGHFAILPRGRCPPVSGYGDCTPVPPSHVAAGALFAGHGNRAPRRRASSRCADQGRAVRSRRPESSARLGSGSTPTRRPRQRWPRTMSALSDTTPTGR